MQDIYSISEHKSCTGLTQMGSEPTKILDISVGRVQRTLLQESKGGKEKMWFSYLFMHDSVFDAEQLKYPADKACFNNKFEPSFELAISWTYKTIWCRLCSQVCLSTLLRLLAILPVTESQDSVHFKLIMLIHSQSQSLKTCKNSSEQFFCTSFPHGHPYSKVEGLT